MLYKNVNCHFSNVKTVFTVYPKLPNILINKFYSLNAVSYFWQLAYPESSGWWFELYLYSWYKSTIYWLWSCTDLLHLLVRSLLCIETGKHCCLRLSWHSEKPALLEDRTIALFKLERTIFDDVGVCLCVCWAESLAKLFSLMDQNSPERVAFVSRALKWSTGGSGKLGHPKLHQLLAVTLWKGNHLIP